VQVVLVLLGSFFCSQVKLGYLGAGRLLICINEYSHGIGFYVTVLLTFKTGNLGTSKETLSFVCKRKKLRSVTQLKVTLDSF